MKAAQQWIQHCSTEFTKTTVFALNGKMLCGNKDRDGHRILKTKHRQHTGVNARMYFPLRREAYLKKISTRLYLHCYLSINLSVLIFIPLLYIRKRR